MVDTEYRMRLNTLNGKNRPYILRKDYDSLRAFIIDTLQQRQQISLMELIELANDKFSKVFSGEVALSLVNTKNDLESLGLVNITHQRNRTQLISLQRSERRMNLSGGYLSTNRDLSIAGDQLERLKRWQVNY